jgi:anthranilate phosphoribosyltransferase
MRSRAVKVHSKHEIFADIVGTGGSQVKTFNVSTAAAFVIAGAGVPVAKHGNRAATSKSGSADVLTELGVKPAVEAVTAEKCLNEIGICFMFAPNFHALSPILGKIRRQLGIPTIFNNLGPLCNPADAPHQVIGVWRKDLIEKTAKTLAVLGTVKSWIVHGSDGLDEITLGGKTFVAEVSNNEVNFFEISPADFGLKTNEIFSYSKCPPAQSAQLTLNILRGVAVDENARDLVLINAAAAIYVAGKALNLREACQTAKESLSSGQALNKLNALIEYTNAD